MSKAVSIGAAGFFGLLAMGVVLHLGSETLAVVVGVLLAVMGIIPLGVLLLAAVDSEREAVQPQQSPWLVVSSGAGALPDGKLHDRISQPAMLPEPGGTRQFHLIGGPGDMS